VKELTDLIKGPPTAVAPSERTPRAEPKAPTGTETFSDVVRPYLAERARDILASFNAPEKPTGLSIDPDPEELKRLLEPVEQTLVAQGSPKDLDLAHFRTLVYLRLLEARARLSPPETMPALNKLFRELHLDPPSLAEHVRRTLLPANAPPHTDLAAVLGTAAAAHPEPQNARDFLAWAARLVTQDLAPIMSERAERPYRSDTEGQLEAAAENALKDGSDVLKLQVELQRLLAEIKTRKAKGGMKDGWAEYWQYRILQAERQLDQLHRAVESQHDALTTLARRSPVRAAPAPVREPVPEPPPAETTAEALTSQH
jgi:hypothetical protein